MLNVISTLKVGILIIQTMSKTVTTIHLDAVYLQKEHGLKPLKVCTVYPLCSDSVQIQIQGWLLYKKKTKCAPPLIRTFPLRREHFPWGYGGGSTHAKRWMNVTVASVPLGLYLSLPSFTSSVLLVFSQASQLMSSHSRAIALYVIMHEALSCQPASPMTLDVSLCFRQDTEVCLIHFLISFFSFRFYVTLYTCGSVKSLWCVQHGLNLTHQRILCLFQTLFYISWCREDVKAALHYFKSALNSVDMYVGYVSRFIDTNYKWEFTSSDKRHRQLLHPHRYFQCDSTS